MPKRRKKKDNRSKVFSIVALVFLLAVLWVWKSIEAHRLSQDLTDLEKTRVELVENNKHLQAELSKLSSIAWVDSCVRHKYGMTYDVKERVVLFDEPKAKNDVKRSMFVSIGEFFGDLIKKVFQ